MTAAGLAIDRGLQPHTAGSRRADLALLGAALLLYLPFIFLGYGSDNDCYGVVDSGRELIQHHHYVPSRPPGYLVYETSIGVLSQIGGSVLCNAASVVMALLSLYCFLRISEAFDVPHRLLLAAALAVQPVFWVSATSTMDYLPALAMLLAGLLLILRRRFILAGIVLGLAVGTRLSSFIAAGIFLSYALWAYPKHRSRIVVGGAIALIVGAVCYLPSFRQAGYSLAFLKAGVGGEEMWSAKMHAGRFVYKNIYLWGLPSVLLWIVAIVLVLLRPQPLLEKRRRPAVALCVLLVLGYEALFAKYPIESGYLLPMVPAALILLGIGLKDRPVFLILFTVSVASYAVVNLNIARPNKRNEASSARVGLWVQPGYVIEDVLQRLPLRHCETLDCYVTRRRTE